MLSFDSFVQQILSYPAQSTQKPGSHVPQLRYYSPTMPDRYNMERLAVYLGIRRSRFPIEPTCPTGNCTIPTFKSVAICSRCASTTSNATLDCHEPKYSAGTDSVKGPCRVVPARGTPSDTSIAVNDENNEYQKQIPAFVRAFNLPITTETRSIAVPVDIV